MSAFSWLGVALCTLQAPAPMSQAPTPSGAASVQSAPGAPGSAGAAVAPEEAPVAPPLVLPEFDGLADGLTKLQVAVGEGKTDVALGLADALLAPNAWAKLRTGLEGEHAWVWRGFDAVEPAVAALGFGGPSSTARAAVHYAAGVAQDRGGDGAQAQARFRTALALAGPGGLRLDAGYNVGAITLGLAERLREAQQQAPPPGALQAQASGAPPGADPLDQLEAAYRAAKSELVERLRADWHDEDLRANLEFIQRRLHEIEKQREEQKQQQQEQKDEKRDPNQKDQQKSDQQKSDEQKQDSKQDPSSSDEERKDSEQQKPEESKPDDQQKSDEQKQGEQKQDESKPDASKSDEQQAKQDEAQQSKEQKDAQPTQGKQEERVLTREEVMRLLSQLEEIEKEGKALQARLRRTRRASAEKDW